MFLAIQFIVEYLNELLWKYFEGNADKYLVSAPTAVRFVLDERLALRANNKSDKCVPQRRKSEILSFLKGYTSLLTSDP